MVSGFILLLYSQGPTANKGHSILQLDKLVGLAMLVVASTVFLYYTIWTLLMVRGSCMSFYS